MEEKESKGSSDQETCELDHFSYKRGMANYILNNYTSINLYYFNHNIFQKMCEVLKEHENILFSPLSISNALTMLLLGSGGYTKRQIEITLGFGRTYSLLYYLKNFHAMLNYASGKTIKCIKLANSVFPEKCFNLVEKYLEDMKLAFNCEVNGLDYKNNAEESKSVINKWVETKTNEKRFS